MCFHLPNKPLSPETFAHLVMFLLSDCSPLYQNNLQEQWVQDVVNSSQIKFEPYGDLVDQAFLQFTKNQNLHNQVGNDDTPGA